MLTPDELIDQLRSGEGEVFLANPNERVRAQYRRAIYAAKERRLVPVGFQLWHTGRDHGDMVIRLLKRHEPPAERSAPAKPHGPTPQAQPALPLVRRTKHVSVDVKPAMASLSVSKALLPRCRAILQQLADDALSRGFEVLPGVEKATVVVVASGEHLPFRLFEEQESAPAPPPTKAELRRYTWRQPPTTIRVPTGRLALRLEHHYRTRTWADRDRWRLEDRLADVIDHIDSLAVAEIERQREAHENGLRELGAWEVAVATARSAYATAYNVRRMRNQAARSARATALRDFAARIGTQAGTEADPSASGQLAEWQTAIQAEAARIDPLGSPTELRWISPEHVRDSDLAPYMPRGMSIHYRPLVPPFPLPTSREEANTGLPPLLRR